MSVQNATLLNTRQAAELLNVSEISIRRWTDAGKLPCQRVGGRRERRFHQQDLIDFLDRQVPKQTQSRNLNQDKVTTVLLDGVSINYGQHLCSLYETDTGQIKLSVPFLADGLRIGDKCFLVASKPIQENIISHLIEAYPEVASAIRNGRLIVSDGIANPQGLYDYFEQHFLAATRQGDQHIRVVGDMGWAVDKGMPIDELMDFEKHYNHALAKRFAVVSICQYDARKFTGTAILNALRNHEDTFQFPLSRFIGF